MTQIYWGLSGSHAVLWVSLEGCHVIMKTDIEYRWKKYIKSSKLLKAGEDEWNDAINARGRLEEEWSRFPTGCEAVPMSNPNWSADEGDNNNWHRNHFITCIVEGLKASWVKPVKNYWRFTRGTRESISFLRKTQKGIEKTYTKEPRNNRGLSNS